MPITYIKISMIVCCLAISFFAQPAIAQKLADFPNASPLQPVPVNVKPDISHNVNSSGNSGNASNPQPPAPASTPAVPAPAVQAIKNIFSQPYAWLVAIFIASALIAFIIFKRL